MIKYYNFAKKINYFFNLLQSKLINKDGENEFVNIFKVRKTFKFFEYK